MYKTNAKEMNLKFVKVQTVWHPSSPKQSAMKSKTVFNVQRRTPVWTNILINIIVEIN